MLLTITCRDQNAPDIGYLLHKNPSRPQSFDMSFGKAYVFYPVVEQEITTVALLLDINPIDLARGKVGSREGGLFDYVNDRPYVSSSFMSTALVKIFSTAMNGRCEKRPELVSKKFDLEANIYMLPCRGETELAERVFKPLGYEISYEDFSIKEDFKEWEKNRYVNLKISGHVKLCDLLNHLYILIPIFDNKKHYWITKDEVEKLIKHSEGWLADHPEKQIITSRYLQRRRFFIDMALERLKEKQDVSEDQTDDEIITEDEDIAVKISTGDDEKPKKSLNALRMESVVREVLSGGAQKVIDIGCGEGNLISLLIDQPQIRKIAGVDVSLKALEHAKEKLKFDRMPDFKKSKLELIQGSLTYKDKRFCDYDAACVTEVIEHLDISRLTAFERVLFEYAAPLLVIITTPNIEYNINYKNLNGKNLRHPDHRFEWTRQQFRDFSWRVCSKYGYSVEFKDIGDADEKYGAPTQMGVFRKCE